MIKKLIGNSAIYGIAPYIPRIVSVFILPILTKHLTDVDYGIAGTISAYIMALTAFSTLGFSAILQVIFFKAPYQYKIFWREVYGFLQFWMIVYALIQAIVLYFIIPKEAIENRWWIILFSNFNTVFFGPSAFLCPLYYQLSQKPIPVAIRSIISGLLTILINYVLIVIYNYGYMGWYVSSFLGGFLVNITYWYDLNKKLKITPIYNFKRKTIISSLKISAPMIPHYYTYFLVNTSNRMVMDQSSISIGKIGEYNLAQQFSTIIESGVSAIEKAITPMCMSELKAKNEIEAKRLIYFFIIITFYSTFIFALWSKEVFFLLINNENLAMAYPIASILALALNYRPVYIGATNVYFYNVKTKEILYITLGAGIIALIGNFIFVPIYGIWGAAIVTYFAFLYQGYSGFFYKPFKEFSTISYPVLKIFSIHIGMSIIALCLINQTLFFKIIISIVATILIIIFTLRFIKK